MSRGSASGFTLIEALVSVALVAIGIASVLGGFASLTISQRKVRDTEKMQRLALQKYDEIVATDSLEATTLSGDFTDYGEDALQWSASVEPTGVENLMALTVTVESRDNPDSEPRQVISGTVYQSPDTGAGTPTGAPTGNGGGG